MRATFLVAYSLTSLLPLRFQKRVTVCKPRHSCFLSHRSILWSIAFTVLVYSHSLSEIRVYFNRSIDASFALPGNVANGNVDLRSKLVARIDSATYSIDMCMYSIDIDSIANHIVAAKQRGVRIRVVYENRNDQSPIPILRNNGIQIMKRKDNNGLMHNKFFVFDGRDSLNAAPWVWAGSWNVTQTQQNTDFNNAIEIRNRSLALAYTKEFEEMWGSSTDNRDSVNAKFGSQKTNNTPHTFTIDGRSVECYFSPSDGTTSKIISKINASTGSANFAILSFTRSDIVSALKSRSVNAGVVVHGMMESIDVQSTWDSLMTFSQMYLHTLPGQLHHKYCILGGGTGGPCLITGSHNWSTAAETNNDENILIIYDSLLVNQYLQEFEKRREDLSSTISGAVFNDANGSGTRDSGEPGLAGWTVNLTGTQSGTAVTNGSGGYSFLALPFGTYTVGQISQGGWSQTMPAPPGTYTLAVNAPTTYTSKDLGNHTSSGVEPTLQASNIQFDAVTSSSMDVTWTNGNGEQRIVVARAGSAVSFAPNDGQAYSANSNFASATDLGSGNKAVFSGSGNAVTVTGLNANTTYYFAVYEFMGSGGTLNYLTTLPATNNQPTLSVTYYSQGNLAPNVVSSWNTDRIGFGSAPSDFASGVPFVIQGGDTMVTTAPWTVSGTGNRIQIESGGVLRADQLISTTTFQIDNGGTYIHNAVGSGTNGASTDLPGSSTRLFGPSSTVQINKWGVVTGTGPVALPVGVQWGNLIINVDTLGGSWQQQSALTTIAGNLIIQKTGGGTREFRLNANTPSTLTVTIAGDLSVLGGILNLINGASILTLTLGGNFSQTGGTFNASGAGPHSFSFTGGSSAASFTSYGGTFTSTSINWTIASGKTLTLAGNFPVSTSRILTINGALTCGANAIMGAGSVAISPGATLGIGSTDGINAGASLGNIRVSGSRTFDPAVNIVLNGTAQQVTGNGFPTSVNNLTINNSNGVTLTGSTTLHGTLVLTSGALSIGTNTLALNGNIEQTSGTLSGGSSSTITFGGSGPSTVLPAVNLQNLTVDRANGISLAGAVTVVGAITVMNGSVSTGNDTIVLGPVATISEPTDDPIQGTVTSTRTVNQFFNNTFGGLGVELNATGGSPGSTIVTRKTGVASVRNGSYSILRYFDLSPTVNSGLSATLVFHYEASELNGHDENALQLWKSTDAGASWELAGGIVNTSARTITVTGVSSFSRWTAADSLHFSSGQVTSSYQMSQGWNIVSVPLDVTDYRKASLFPTSISAAFVSVQGLGYVIRDTLMNGPGYWLKFPSLQTVNMIGLVRNHDTLSVTTGWNLIGSTSVPVAVTAIQQIPTGIVTSSFFQYLGSYVVADSVRPANGYWVKVNQNGRLILR